MENAAVWGGGGRCEAEKMLLKKDKELIWVGRAIKWRGK
jgi:hypothetical protein